MSKRRLSAGDDPPDIAPPQKARRMSSRGPSHRLSLSNCWDIASDVQEARASDCLLASVFSDWDASFNGALAEPELAALLGITAGSRATYLRRLDLSYSTAGDSFFLSLGVFAPNLEALRLQGCQNLTDVGLSALAQLCPNLSELSVAFCPRLSDRGVAVAVRHLPLLKALDLRGCSGVTGSCMKVLVQRCPLVQVLRLGGTSVDAPTLSALLSYFLLLELDVSSLPLTDVHLKRLAEKQPLLEVLDISLCHGVSGEGVEALLGAAPLKQVKAFGLADALAATEDSRLIC